MRETSHSRGLEAIDDRLMSGPALSSCRTFRSRSAAGADEDIEPRFAGNGGGKEVRFGRTLGAVVLAQRVEQHGAEHGVAVAPALAGADMNHHALRVDVADAQAAGFGHSQAGTVGAEQRQAVSGRCQGTEHLGHLAGARDIEQGTGTFGNAIRSTTSGRPRVML